MLSSRSATEAYISVEDSSLLESMGGARDCSPDRVGGNSQQENDLDDEDDKILPGAIIVAGLELLSYQEDHPQHYHLRDLHDDRRFIIHMPIYTHSRVSGILLLP